MARSSYQLMDSGNFQKLEQVGENLLIRPCAQAVWSPTLAEKEWQKARFRFDRDSSGNGTWQVLKQEPIPEAWSISLAGATFEIKLTDFGHLGIFPEQQENWIKLESIIANSLKRLGKINVLNLFAYTGGATLACVRAGAQVSHIDSSKTSVSWARKNAELSGLADRPIRWLIEDAQKFVGREIKRGAKYHGIVLDPPSFGRGAKNEVWKIDDHLRPLLEELPAILDSNFLFLLLSGHTPGYSPLVLFNLTRSALKGKKGQYQSEEMALPEESSTRRLPSGTSCLFINSW